MGSFTSVEEPSRIPTRRTAERTPPAATAHARSVSRSPGTTGTAGVSVRAAGRRRVTCAERMDTDQPLSACPSDRDRSTGIDLLQDERRIDGGSESVVHEAAEV